MNKAISTVLFSLIATLGIYAQTFDNLKTVKAAIYSDESFRDGIRSGIEKTARFEQIKQKVEKEFSSEESRLKTLGGKLDKWHGDHFKAQEEFDSRFESRRVDGKLSLPTDEFNAYQKGKARLEADLSNYMDDLKNWLDAGDKHRAVKKDRIEILIEPIFKEAHEFASALFKQHNIIPVQSDGELVIETGTSEITESLIQAFKNYLLSNQMPASFSVPDAKVFLLNIDLVLKAREENTESEELEKVLESYFAKKNIKVLLNSSKTIPADLSASAKDVTADFLIYYKQQQGLAYEKEQTIEQKEKENAKAENFYREGASAYNRKDFNTAITEFTKAVEMNPEHAQSYAGRGYAHLNLKKFDLALRDFNKSINIDPGNHKLYSDRAYIYYQTGELDLAITDYSKAIALKSDSFEAFHFRGHTYRKQNKLDLALADFSKAIQIQSNVADLYCDRADIYSIQKKFGAALSDLDKAIEYDPKEVRAYSIRTKIYCLQGKPTLAAADEEMLISLGQTLNQRCQ